MTTTDLSNIPAQLRKMADDLEAGTLQEKTCIVLLTSEESDDFASYFFGEEVTYGRRLTPWVGCSRCWKRNEIVLLL